MEAPEGSRKNCNPVALTLQVTQSTGGGFLESSQALHPPAQNQLNDIEDQCEHEDDDADEKPARRSVRRKLSRITQPSGNKIVATAAFTIAEIP